MKKHLIILLVSVASCLSVAAQGRSGLRINEVMVTNENSVVDDFGDRPAWIELFNSTFGPLEISSVYLTTDPEQPRMYPVPLGDVNTRIPKRQHVIFWADNDPTRGTFHTSLTLDPTRPNWIGIYDANGVTLIDSVTVPVMQPDQSWARAEDGVNAAGWELRTGLTDHDYVTPSSNNRIKDTNDKIIQFQERDPRGFALTLMAMGIVFCALLVLCLSFMLISKIGESVTKRNKYKAQGIVKKEVAKADRPQHDSGEEIAAIVMALHEHLDAHDTEQTILTINKVKKTYSPWSSKIYSLRDIPNRK